MNPFDPGNPADESLFSGRKVELAEARKSFESTLQNRPDHLLFCGERGIGKTSIINHLQKEYTARNALFVFCGLGECGSMDEVVEQFVTRFYRELTNRGTAAGTRKKVKDFFSSFTGVTIGQFSVSFKSKEDVQQITPHFSQLLATCWRQIESEFKCLVVVFDEADKLASGGEATDAFAQGFVFALRNVIEEVGREGAGQIKFLLSATPEVRLKMKTVHESLLRSLRIVELGRFDQDAMRELLDKGLAASERELQYTPVFLKGLKTYSDGIPFHVQAICHYALEADQDGLLGEDDLHDGVLGAVHRLNQYPFGIWWKQVENWGHARQLLILLAESAGASSPASLGEATKIARPTISALVSRLREVGFVSPTGARGDYKLSSELCRVWVNKHLRGKAAVEEVLG